jgi:general stress protein 26
MVSAILASGRPGTGLSAENPRRTQMPKSTPIPELNAAFSEPDVTAPPWSDVEAVLSAAEMFWLATTRRDGRPHVTPLPAIWFEGALHICVGRHEQKAKNLAHDSRCILTTGTNQLRSGLGVIVEGTAERVTDQSRLFRLAELWRSKLDWHLCSVGPRRRLATARGCTPLRPLRARRPCCA